jgi:hypothetical protein
MLYNLSNPLDIEQARRRLLMLEKQGACIEIRKKQVKRTLPQNAYLHLILGYFASQIGETLEYVKKFYYKAHCNPDLFVIHKEDRIYHVKTTVLRSSADLTVDEMSTSIERFRNWAANEIGIYIPEAKQHDQVLQMQQDVERCKNYI